MTCKNILRHRPLSLLVFSSLRLKLYPAHDHSGASRAEWVRTDSPEERLQQVAGYPDGIRLSLLPERNSEAEADERVKAS